MASSELSGLAAEYLLQIVGGGNGWWVTDQPGASSISTYVFVDVEAVPALLQLPDLSADPSWRVAAEWQAAGRSLRLHISGPVSLTVALDLDRPEFEAVRRARQLFVCPTTRSFGLDPYLARDRSFAVRLPALQRD
ncbi:MAG: hypothetical protein ACYDCQ_06450 [Dehalococcoidia bacterium]